MKRWLIAVFSFVSLNTFASSAEDISAADLQAADKQDWLIIDVRSAKEYAEGHVPGAINIAHSDMAQSLDQILNYKDKPVVVYCQAGYRAGKAAKILIENAFSQVKHLDGDMGGWKQAGYPIEK